MKNPKTKKESDEWVQTTWPFDPDYAKIAPPIWVKKFGRGKVYLRDEKDFTYTCSFGASSDYSYTGCFFSTGLKTLKHAMAVLDEIISMWLCDVSYQIRDRRVKYLIEKLNENNT